MTGPERKRVLTFHERQMRFFTILFTILGALGTALICWLMNSSAFSRH